MDISQMKNIVVLKNLPSNIVDEAIVVLKQNKKIKKPQYIEKNDKNKKDIKSDKNIKNGTDYIVKEAEMIVSDYITGLETSRKKVDSNLEQKYKNLKMITWILAAVSFCQLAMSVMN